MVNEFYVPGDLRAARVKDLFTRIAPRYDLINDLQSFGLHRYWKNKLVNLARPAAMDKALDLCCGTGDLAFLMAQRGARVLGVDFSERMLEVALNRNQRARRFDGDSTGESTPRQVQAAPHFVQGDALRLPVPDKSFDIVTMAYGLRNLADIKAGLGEMRRVMKPGGRLLVLDFGKPDNAIWRGVYFGYLRIFVPLLGRIFVGSASAYAYILESLRHYPAQRGVAAQMTELGLANVRIINLLGGVMSINYAENQSSPR
jgi:demethylmenaquinone methyltransferase/2-methoxy-6-polyprenyl-1,4-benzoquinol methylase